jgi:hypothetical protein
VIQSQIRAFANRRRHVAGERPVERREVGL